MSQYLECPICERKRDVRRTKFHQVDEKKICHQCYKKEIFNKATEFINEELRKKSNLENFIRVVTLDLGALTNTRTKAHEAVLRMVITGTAIDEEFKLTRDDLEFWVERKGGYKTSVDEIINALASAGFIEEVESDTYKPGINAIDLARGIKTFGFRGREREVIQHAFGILNITLLKDGKHKLWVTTMLEGAQKILEAQEKTKSLTFEIHLADFLRIGRDVGLSDWQIINNLNKFIGLSGGEAPPEPAFFDGIEYYPGSIDPNDLGWDIGLVMKKEWVQFRERLNQRMRYIWW